MKGTKTGGREQGTPNRLTKEMRTILKEIVSKELNLISENIDKLEPEKRTEILLKLLPYVLPKVEAVNMEKGEPMTFDFT